MWPEIEVFPTPVILGMHPPTLLDRRIEQGFFPRVDLNVFSRCSMKFVGAYWSFDQLAFHHQHPPKCLPMRRGWKLRLSMRYNSGTSCRMNWGGGKQAAKSDYYGLLQGRRSEGTNWGRRNRKGEGDIGKGRAHEWNSRRVDNNIYYPDRMQATKLRSYLINIARKKRFKNTAESFQKNVGDKEAISGRFILISSGIQRISLRSSPRHLRPEFRFVIPFVTAWGSPWPRHLDRTLQRGHCRQTRPH